MLSLLKNKINHLFLIIFLISWVYIWMITLNRNFSNHFEETKKLCGKSLEEKWRYIFGDDLYQLISKSKGLIPFNKKIYFIHNLQAPKSFLASYFLYPREETENADFILVYKQPFKKSGDAKVIYAQDPDIFIIKK